MNTADYMFQNSQLGSVEAIIAHCREKLARHMVSAAVTVVRSLPLNPYGNVIESELRKMALTASDRPAN